MFQCCRHSADYANFWKKYWFIGTIGCIGLILNEKITRLTCKPYINQVSYVSKSVLEILTEGMCEDWGMFREDIRNMFVQDIKNNLQTLQTNSFELQKWIPQTKETFINRRN